MDHIQFELMSSSENFKVFWEYILEVRRERIEAREALLGRLKHFTTIHMVLFGALSFGVNRLQPTWLERLQQQHTGDHPSIAVVGLGLVAAGVVFLAFLFATYSLFAVKYEIASLNFSNADQNYMLTASEADVRRALCNNMLHASRNNDKHLVPKDKRNAMLVSFCTALGMLLTALFVSVALL